MPSLPRITPNPRGFGRRAGAEDFGAAEGAAQAERGQAVAGFGSALGDIEQAEQRIFRARNEAKAGRLAAELAAADDEAVFALETDPELETHGARFEKGRAERLRAAQDQLPPEFRAELEARAFASGAQGRGRVRQNVQRRALEDGRADLAEAGRIEADRAAVVTDPRERDQIRAGRVQALDGAMKSGLLTQAQRDAALRDFDRTVSGADLRAIIAADPLGALGEMDNPASGILRGYDAAEAEVWREQARDQYRQQLGERRAARAEVRANAERAEREAGEAAMRNVLDATAEGDPAKLRAELERSRDVLTPEQYAQGLRWLGQGGRFGGEKTSPQLYIDLSNAAARGEPVGAAADEAVVKGLLTKADRDRVVRVSEGKRFPGARRLIESVGKQGFLAKYDEGKGLRDAQMVKDYDDWAAENPEATREQAEAQARDLMRRAGYGDLLGLQQQGATLGADTIEARGLALQAQFQAGQITQAEYDRGLELLDQEEAAQRLVETPK